MALEIKGFINVFYKNLIILDKFVSQRMFDSVNSISQLWIILGSLYSVGFVSILSCLSDSAPCKRISYFQAQILYLSLRTC